MGLRRYFARRAVYTIILLFVVIVINFVIFQLMPGNPAALLADSSRLGTQERVEALLELYGLNQPIEVRFAKYVRNMIFWDFGFSYLSGKPVATEILLRMPNTLLLLGVSTIFALILGTILGIYAASKRGSKLDLISIGAGLVFTSLPTFWMGIIFLFFMGYVFRLFPLAGTLSYPPPQDPLAMILDILWHLTGPGLVLLLFNFGTYVLLTRSAVLEALSEDYIITARAKGVDERGVLFHHAFRNALLPLLTNAVLAIAGVISGAIITEGVFSWEGMGLLTINAIFNVDYPMLQGLFYVFGVVTISAVLIADVTYGFIDPRIKYS